ncbi:Uncharacterised protein [Escherichia coli]|nr:Uncharacterised protein [Escherichia coli]
MLGGNQHRLPVGITQRDHGVVQVHLRHRPVAFIHHGHRAGVLHKGFSRTQGIIGYPQRLQDSERAFFRAGIPLFMPGGMNGLIDGMPVGVEFGHNQRLLLCLRCTPHPVIPDSFNDVGSDQ